MSQENEKHRNKMGLIAPARSTDVDERIGETEELLRNTQSFLDGLRESDERTRSYVRDISESLERDLQRLQTQKEGK